MMASEFLAVVREEVEEDGRVRKTITKKVEKVPQTKKEINNSPKAKNLEKKELSRQLRELPEELKIQTKLYHRPEWTKDNPMTVSYKKKKIRLPVRLWDTWKDVKTMACEK